MRNDHLLNIIRVQTHALQKLLSNAQNIYETEQSLNPVTNQYREYKLIPNVHNNNVC